MDGAVKKRKLRFFFWANNAQGGSAVLCVASNNTFIVATRGEQRSSVKINGTSVHLLSVMLDMDADGEGEVVSIFTFPMKTYVVILKRVDNPVVTFSILEQGNAADFGLPLLSNSSKVDFIPFDCG